MAVAIEVAGARLHARLDGPPEAPVVVLANSLGTTLEMWSGQVPMLTQRFRVLRYDMRGHGASSLSTRPFDIGDLGRDVLSLLDLLELERVHFCGLSLGGMVGLWLGAHAPERLNKLAMCNTAAQIGPRSSWDARIAAVTEGGMLAIADAVLERWLSARFRDREPSAVECLRRMLLTTSPAGYVAGCAVVRDTDQRRAAADVRAATLVIAGDHDAATPPRDGRWLADRIVGARYVALPAAHLSNIETEVVFNQTLWEFLTG